MSFHYIERHKYYVLWDDFMNFDTYIVELVYSIKPAKWVQLGWEFNISDGQMKGRTHEQADKPKHILPQANSALVGASKLLNEQADFEMANINCSKKAVLFT